MRGRTADHWWWADLVLMLAMTPTDEGALSRYFFHIADDRTVYRDEDGLWLTGPSAA